MSHKSFKRAQNLDPISFDLPVGDGDDVVEFKCENEIPSGVIFAFTETKDSVDPDAKASDESDALASVLDLFRAAIIDGQVDQFMTLIRTKEKGQGIPASMLMDIATWLGEQYSARPTGQSSAAGQSAKPSGPPSTDGVLHAVTTYSKPEPVALST